MLIVIDQRAPKEAKSNLSQFGKLVEFNTHGIVYPAISGHPDIFICQTPSCLIIAPSIPKIYTDLLKSNNIAFEYGNSIVGSKFPETSYYNCVTNGHYLFHKKGFTDKEILLRNESLELIEMPQAYTRCNLIEISKDTFITSDRGIEKNLLKNAFKAHYFSPEDILLPEMPHGFIGGALGLYGKKLFALGDPRFHSWGKDFVSLIGRQGLELIPLYQGPFYDGGGIFFLE